MNRCDLQGSSGTIGVYCLGGKVNLRECSFRDHGGVALWANGAQSTSVLMKNSTLSHCGEGIILNGPFCSSVENNTIADCQGTGIITLFGNSSNIINNEIRDSKCGA